ncbi:hypothetical protein [Pelomonas sp. SE-A7]|uniref:helix-turn-helix transcriptional regulator n=1 Tax=Pelomonas sp. SE-A7 TaxID=3054953 RepID=UPI00259CACD6|nr:hypothetical protein [Pelomonas sp. SE-A7]MDM4767279.1 hypothetical protein [Pelomonas sp. SE-A7]
MPRHITQKSAQAADHAAVSRQDEIADTGAAKWTREVFDTEGAAAYLKVSRQLLELLRVTGGGPRYVKLTRLVRYRKAALDEWLVDNERAHTSEGVAQ